MDLKPVLYVSNQTLVDENLLRIGNRFSTSPQYDLYHELSHNRLSGCTMVMNQELRAEIIKEQRTPSDRIVHLRLHDTWCMIVANIMGTVVYDRESRILYRQHANNVVGAKKMSKIEVLKDKTSRFTTKKYKGLRRDGAEEILKIFHENLSPEERSDLEEMINCRSFRGAIRLIRNPRLRPIFSESTFLLFVKAIMGWI